MNRQFARIGLIQAALCWSRDASQAVAQAKQLESWALEDEARIAGRIELLKAVAPKCRDAQQALVQAKQIEGWALEVTAEATAKVPARGRQPA